MNINDYKALMHDPRDMVNLLDVPYGGRCCLVCGKLNPDQSKLFCSLKCKKIMRNK